MSSTERSNTGPASLWPPTTQHAADDAAARVVSPSATFDACHVGVVLRVVAGVHAALAVGTLFGAPGFTGWLLRFAEGSAVALPAVLAWLVVACAARAWLARLGAAAQGLAAAALGAAAAAASALVWGAIGIGAAEPLACAAAGALAGGSAWGWLRLRARSGPPAETVARLAELQSRIRPHFLFNTLNTALALVRVDPARAEAVLEDLAELFRVALQDASAAVALADEIELARRYLAIEQVRFGPRLAVEWDLDADAGRARVPPLMLQPLVENAVRHGIEPAEAGGTIRVRTQCRGGRAVLTVDNTVGAGPSLPGAGIALANVRERLALMHDVAAQMDVRAGAGRHRVRIAIPL